MRIGRIREPSAKLEKKLADSLEQQFATSDVLLGSSSSHQSCRDCNMRGYDFQEGQGSCHR
jgi:hypothetical protein